MIETKNPSHKSTPDNPLDGWPDFVELVRRRMEKGRLEYGNESFTRWPSDLVGEIEEELADVCGWAFILWARIRGLQSKIGDSQI